MMRKASAQIGAALIIFAAAVALAAGAVSSFRWGAILFGYVSLAGCVLVMGLFFCSPSRRANAALALLSTVIGIYLVEAALRIPAVEQIGTHEAAAASMRLPFDTRSQPEVIQAMGGLEAGVWPTLYAGEWLPDGFPSRTGRLFPLGGPSRRMNVFCNESGEYAIFQADEHGFNNGPGLYRPGAVDVAIVGDSMAQGACVPPGRDVAGRLRRQGWNALSLAVGGNGPLVELATVREYARPLRPRVTLLMFFEGNDMIELLRESRSSILMSYQRDPEFTQRLIQRQPEIDALLEEYYRERRPAWDPAIASVRNFLTMRELRARLVLGRVAAGLRQDELLDAYQGVLARVRDDVRSWGGAVFLVYLPSWERYFRSYDDRVRQRVLRSAADLDVPVIDFHPLIEKLADPFVLFPLRIGPHFSAEGYSFIARTLEETLINAGFRVSHAAGD